MINQVEREKSMREKIKLARHFFDPNERNRAAADAALQVFKENFSPELDETGIELSAQGADDADGAYVLMYGEPDGFGSHNGVYTCIEKDWDGNANVRWENYQGDAEQNTERYLVEETTNVFGYIEKNKKKILSFLSR